MNPQLRIVILSLVLTPALLGAPAPGGGLRPDVWGGSLAVAYDHRVPGPLGLGNPDQGTGDPQFWFARPEDWQGSLRLWAQKKLHIAGQRARIELGYEHQEWAHGRILGRDLYSAELRQTLSPRARLVLELDYTPQIYVRHRVDKDAAAGTLRFRPQAYEGAGARLGYRRSWTPGFHTTAFVTYEIRNEKPWFNERDRRRHGFGFASELPLGGGVRIKPLYALRISRSRNEPDLGSDRSYREHLLEMLVRMMVPGMGGALDMEIKLRWKVRAYTTGDPEDTSRYGRQEQIYQWMIKLRRPFGSWAPFLTSTGNGRWVEIPAEESTIDEDGEIDRTLIRLGLEWRR